MMFSTADSVAIYEDEGRFYIRVQTDEGEVILIDIHAQAVGFYENVQAELGGWAREALEARHAVRNGVSREDYLGAPQPVTSRPVSVEDAIEAGYALDDPKSPGYHERMVD